MDVSSEKCVMKKSRYQRSGTMQVDGRVLFRDRACARDALPLSYRRMHAGRDSDPRPSIER